MSVMLTKYFQKQKNIMAAYVLATLVLLDQ